MHFIPSLLSNLATLQVPGHPESPPAQHKEVTRSYLHSAALTCLEWDLGELPFERYQIGSLSHSGWEGVPETNCFREKAVFIIVTGSRDLPEFQWVMGSCPRGCRSQVGIWWYIYESMYYFEEHNEPVFGSPCLQRFPVEVVKHWRNTTGVAIPVCDVPGRPSLDHFQLVDVPIGKGAPYSWAVF